MDDLTHITADYLIDNVELAFKVWREVPWGEDIPFNVFCELILPYRLEHEPLENWREKALASFADVYDAFLKDDTLTTVTACGRLNALLPRFRLDADFPDMSFSQLMASSRGPCDAMVAAAVFSMRALGIPVAKDYTTKWPNMEVGHSWNSVYDGQGDHITFMGTEADPGEPHQATQLLKYKVFRSTFGRQLNIEADTTDIPPGLRNMNMIDVSSKYPACTDIVVPMLFQPEKPTGYAYLAIRIDNKWEPIAWGKHGQSEIHFSGVGKNQLYLPVYYADNEQTSANYPFVVEEDGSCRFITTDSVRNELVLTGIDKDTDNFLSLMLHGRFEGANNEDFSNARLLYQINEVPEGYYHSVTINDPSEFRYVRYSSRENERCNVAEVEFFDKDGYKLTGTVIGRMGSSEKMARENVFDGDVSTTVNIGSDTTAWIGLDLGRPSAIGEIRFLPRNLGNNIYEGHRYRLSYWDGRRWINLKKQIAKSHQLLYLAPSNALFCLQNQTRDVKGRYFTMKDGVQEWL